MGGGVLTLALPRLTSLLPVKAIKTPGPVRQHSSWEQAMVKAP